MICPSCRDGSLQDLNIRNKDGTKIEMYKCNGCKKYVKKTGKGLVVQPDAPRQKEQVKEPPRKVEEPISLPSNGTCEVCGKIIDEERQRRGGTTCGKECSAINNQRKKDEYHRLRKLRLASKKGHETIDVKELLSSEVVQRR